MRLFLLSLFAVLVAGCSGLQERAGDLLGAVGVIASDPEAAKVATELGGSDAAVWLKGIALVATTLFGKWGVDKVKASEPGKLIG